MSESVNEGEDIVGKPGSKFKHLCPVCGNRGSPKNGWYCAEHKDQRPFGPANDDPEDLVQAGKSSPREIESVHFRDLVAASGKSYDSSGFRQNRDGTCEETPTGVLLHAKNAGNGKIRDVLVPWANVRFVLYAEAK